MAVSVRRSRPLRGFHADPARAAASQPWRTPGDAGFTLIELLVVVGIVGVVAAISIPSLVRARVNANEGSAIASLKAIGSAQASYSSSAGRGAYSATLAALAAPCPAAAQGFISPDLAQDLSMKSGYLVAVQAAAAALAGGPDCNGTATTSDFYSTATPLSASSGTRAFASNARATIYFDVSGVPPTEAAMAPGGGAVPIQ